jgi:diaminohydroxyphosphoribosylaminopyrimidine deaminase / 5-amino-6-(5-phosphoribosylamino)uracil reductase
MHDHYFLNFAFHLALENEGKTSPNPSVGAVIVRGSNLVSWGYHEKAGGPHAEVVALARAGDRARNSTLYCTLEPCAHHGKTGPCVEQIIASGVSRVVFGTVDQNPLVAGRGLAALRQGGIQTEEISMKSINQFYRPFFRTFATKRPYVIAKVAMTGNGIISPADRNSRWITNETSLAWVHQLRATCDAILVGADTVLLDRPSLTVRAADVDRHPLRIILDSRFKLHPEECSLLESKGPILLCGSRTAPARKEECWKDYPVQVIRFDEIQDLMTRFFEMGLRKILVEGGQKIFTLFHVAGIVDEYALMVAPRLLTGKHFLNFLAGPEQSLAETERYKVDQLLDLDGDLLMRMRTSPQN